MSDGGALQRLARVPLLQRLSPRAKAPLRLQAVPRDHVAGSKAIGHQLLEGRYTVGGEAVTLADLDWLAVGTVSPLGASLHGFSWLRDLAAAATRERGAGLAESLVARWLQAHGEKVDAAWAPALWGERLLFWLAYAPYLLSRRDAAYRSALLNTMARGSRHLGGAADDQLLMPVAELEAQRRGGAAAGYSRARRRGGVDHQYRAEGAEPMITPAARDA